MAFAVAVVLLYARLLLGASAAIAAAFSLAVATALFLTVIAACARARLGMVIEFVHNFILRVGVSPIGDLPAMLRASASFGRFPLTVMLCANTVRRYEYKPFSQKKA